MSDCELMVIERRDFIQFLRNQPDMTLKFIEILCSRLRHTSEQVQDLTFLNLPTRLAKALLQLTSQVEIFGAEAQGRDHSTRDQSDHRQIAREHQ